MWRDDLCILTSAKLEREGVEASGQLRRLGLWAAVIAIGVRREAKL